jgi:hypothetical protein
VELPPGYPKVESISKENREKFNPKQNGSKEVLEEDSLGMNIRLKDYGDQGEQKQENNGAPLSHLSV